MAEPKPTNSAQRVTLSPYQSMALAGGLGFFTGRGYSYRTRVQLLSGADVQMMIERSPQTLLSILVELVPEVGYAVNQFLSLCCDEETSRLAVMHRGSDGQGEENPSATRLVTEAWGEQPPEVGNFYDALSQNFLMMLLSGMSAAEVVLPDRGTMECYPVNTWTLELVRDESGKVLPYQKQVAGRAYVSESFSSTGLTLLPEERFFYSTLYKLPGMLYPVAPFSTAVSEVLAVMSFMRDLIMATHKAGFPRVHYELDTNAIMTYGRDILGIVNPEDMTAFMATVRDGILEAHRLAMADDGVVYGNEAQAKIMSAATFPPIKEIWDILLYRLAIGLKIPPSIMGMMGTGRTEGWSQLQWELFSKQIRSYLQKAGNPLKRSSQKFLQNRGRTGTVELLVKTPHGIGQLLNAQARQIEIQNAVLLRDQGLVSQESIAMELTGSAPVSPEPIWRGSSPTSPAGTSGDNNNSESSDNSAGLKLSVEDVKRYAAVVEVWKETFGNA